MFNKLFMPFRLKVLDKFIKGRDVAFLGVGCGATSPRITKRYYPQLRYHGIDLLSVGTPELLGGTLEKFYQLNLVNDSLSSVPDCFFDIVEMSHVIEHLSNGMDVIRQVLPKVQSAGRVYIEFPSVKSLSLPSMPDTLHFCDDPTHIRIYSIAEVANVLLDNNFKIIKSGVRRDWVRIVFLPIIVPLRYLMRGRISGADFWDLTGFAEFVYAERRLAVD